MGGRVHQKAQGPRARPNIRVQSLQILNTQLLIKQTSTDKLNAWPPSPPAVRRAGNEGRVHLRSPTLLTGTTDSEVTNMNPNAIHAQF